METEKQDWLILALVWVGSAIGRTLTDPEPIVPRRLVGEILLALVGSFIMYEFGLYQNMETNQMLLVGSLAGLGGVRMIEIFLKGVKAIGKMKIG